LTAIKRPVVLTWELSSYFGWGVYGINLLLNWMAQQSEPLLTTKLVNADLIKLNPLEWALIRPALERSHALQTQLKPFGGQQVEIDLPVLHALGNELGVPAPAAGEVKVTGNPTLGLTFFEATSFSLERRERAKDYPLIIAGSSWNYAVLNEAGIGPIAKVLQGIDPSMFHPAPKAGLFANRFAIFSGGKLEYRKSQDLVLKAFRIFAQRHSEAVLVTAWSSPWPFIAHTLDTDDTLAPVSFRPNGALDVPAWAAANGIAAHQILDLGAVANAAMPRLYREMNVALFPNRCEGGTNLVAMECMACGVPVILSNNTGHLDLIAPDRCFILAEQATIPGAERLGWGESNVEEIVETLESVHRDRSGSLARGARGAEFMSTMTWAETVRRLTATIEPYL
jgi:glycosyltransferase involved in cell wall biosynthesis